MRTRFRLRPRREQRLSRARGSLRISPRYVAGSFGEKSEDVARFLGTGRYLFIQTIVVVVWIAINVLVAWLRWDPYPFILLNLMFSTQAAYAAPLILLAQNRQAERDREQAEIDRQTNRRTQAEAEFLARELASVRIHLTDAITNDDLDRAVERVLSALDRQIQNIAEPQGESREPDRLGDAIP